MRMRHVDRNAVVLGSSTRTQTSGTRARDLLWLRLDFGSGRAFASSTDDAFYLSIITVVAQFVWRSTRLVERLEGFVAREARLVALQVAVERVQNLGSSPGLVTGYLSVTGGHC